MATAARTSSAVTASITSGQFGDVGDREADRQRPAVVPRQRRLVVLGVDKGRARQPLGPRQLLLAGTLRGELGDHRVDRRLHRGEVDAGRGRAMDHELGRVLAPGRVVRAGPDRDLPVELERLGEP